MKKQESPGFSRGEQVKEPLREKRGRSIFERMRAAGFLAETPKVVAAPPEWVALSPSDTQAQRYAAAALKSECERVATAIEGTRNDTLNRAAFNLGRFVHHGHLDGDTVMERLAEAAALAGLAPPEIHNTVSRAVGDGGRKLDAPHPSGGHDTTPPVTTLDEGEPITAAGVLTIDDVLDDQMPRVNWRELWDAEREEEEWLIDGLVPMRRGIALYSASGVGKSLLTLEVAASIASGRPFSDLTTLQAPVLYLDYENDPQGDVIVRLKDMGYTPDQLDDLHLCSYPSIETMDTAIGGQKVLALATRLGAQLVVFDTASRTIVGEENSNDTWLQWYNHTGLALKRAGIAYIRIDHTGKDHTKGARGGSAKTGDVDLIWKFAHIEGDMYTLEREKARGFMDDPALLTVYRKPVPTLRHLIEFDQPDDYQVKVGAIMRLLDQLGVAANAGRVVARKALREYGSRTENRVLEEAVRRRKGDAGIVFDEDPS